MDEDRPVVDGRDIFESKLQDLLLEAWGIGFCDGYDDECSAWQKELYPKLHELIVSYLDGQTGDAGPQDEPSEERSEGYLRQLTSREPDEIKISEDGTAIFKIWNVLQNPR